MTDDPLVVRRDVGGQLERAHHAYGLVAGMPELRPQITRRDLRTRAWSGVVTVMADAADLVEIGHILRQVVNVKGE